ncbi:MAG: iron ABC transporter permease [Ndongobacter sp.]|nr:iron ABC transporter permease [Ndongobacter sp.]
MSAENKKIHLRFILLFLGTLFLLLISIAGGIAFGSADLTIATVFDVICARLFGAPDAALSNAALSIVWELRLPRALLAIAAGGGLAVAGTAMQSITQNALADPYILGVSGGASAAVALGFVLGGPLTVSSIGISTFAFLGATLALLLVYSVGLIGSSGSNSRLVLAGMAVSVILTAATQFFISVAPDTYTVRNITSWTMGSLAGARWHNLPLPFFGSVLGSAFFIFTARNYNLLSQGDDTAISLGINVKSVKKYTLLAVSFITGVIVAAGGVIGFVGFIIPHIVRSVVGANHQKVFPLAFITGSLFLVWMDVLSRVLFAPKELPVGIFTAFCGGPFFIWLLYKKNRAQRG